MTDPRNNQPLTPAVFHILLALANGPCHGYGIMKQVEIESQGKVSMGPGTLYGSLKRMLEAGLVEESGSQADPDAGNERRIYYKMTGAGKKALAAELLRFKHLVALAQEHHLDLDEGVI
jgi:DNA-binding PadR family transcriptional regulator